MSKFLSLCRELSVGERKLDDELKMVSNVSADEVKLSQYRSGARYRYQVIMDETSSFATYRGYFCEKVTN